MSETRDPASNPVHHLSRRGFLAYVGAGAAVFVAAQSPGCLTGNKDTGDKSSWVLPDGRGNWTSPPYPLPLPGDLQPLEMDAQKFGSYTVVDDLVLPQGWSYHLIATWGDRIPSDFMPDGWFRFGFNCDYTGLLPHPAGPDHFWLFVNHEELSFRTWQQGFVETTGLALPQVTLTEKETLLDGQILPEKQEDFNQDQRQILARIATEGLNDLGVSILHLTRDSSGKFKIAEGARDHKRISCLSHREPGQGRPAVAVSGPASVLFSSNPPGTFSNCSGGTSSWGSFLTCEENIQNQTTEFVDPTGKSYASEPEGLDVYRKGPGAEPNNLFGLGHLLETPLVGTHFGWVCEVDPQSGQMTKHTSLGRFRHENVALRCFAGQNLAAYMGDDRRGGHVWKYVSKNLVLEPKSKTNSELLHEGTLYVAGFQAGYRGRWIALTPETPLAEPEPEHMADGFLALPNRPEGGPVSVAAVADDSRIDVATWKQQIEAFTGKAFANCTLGDLVSPEVPSEQKQAVILADAFLMGNAAGGTPTSRPEDLEVHPGDRSIYISFTDHTGDHEGSPDTRIFPDSRRANSRQYGAIYRLVDETPASLTFAWGQFVSSGETAQQGGGFACADNLVFDRDHNMWMVTDISTSLQNFPADREGKYGPGDKRYMGAFGNNSMFMIPTAGANAGVPQLFATAPCDSELTGPTFSEDGRTLILSVQHPGEMNGTGMGQSQEQTFRIADRREQVFTQKRIVPVGSNWPGKNPGDRPRPAVVCIIRES